MSNGRALRGSVLTLVFGGLVLPILAGAVQKLGAVFSHSEIKAPTGVPRATYCYRLAKAVWLARLNSATGTPAEN